MHFREVGCMRILRGMQRGVDLNWDLKNKKDFDRKKVERWWGKIEKVKKKVLKNNI